MVGTVCVRVDVPGTDVPDQTVPAGEYASTTAATTFRGYWLTCSVS